MHAAALRLRIHVSRLAQGVQLDEHQLRRARPAGDEERLGALGHRSPAHSCSDGDRASSFRSQRRLREFSTKRCDRTGPQNRMRARYNAPERPPHRAAADGLDLRGHCSPRGTVLQRSALAHRPHFQFRDTHRTAHTQIFPTACLQNPLPQLLRLLHQRLRSPLLSPLLPPSQPNPPRLQQPLPLPVPLLLRPQRSPPPVLRLHHRNQLLLLLQQPQPPLLQGNLHRLLPPQPLRLQLLLHPRPPLPLQPLRRKRR